MRTIEIPRKIVDRAAAAAAEGKVTTIATYSSPGGKVIAFEYWSDSAKATKCILFQENGTDLLVHHPDPCPGFKKEPPSCWHLGLYGVHEGIKIYEAVVQHIDMPGSADFVEDVTRHRTGAFEILPNGRGAATPSIPAEESPSATEEERPKGKRTPRKPKEKQPVAAVRENPIADLLDSYKIKGLLKDRVLQLREENLKTLTATELAMVPNPFDHLHYPTGSEIVNGLAALTKTGWVPYLLTGGKGTGKSNLARLLAGILGLPVLSLNASGEMGQEVLLGGNTLKYEQSLDKADEAKVRYALLRTELAPALKDKIVKSLSETKADIYFKPGALLESSRRGYMFLLEEMNLLTPETQTSMNMLLDEHRSIYVPGEGTEKPHPRFRFVATMNPGYMGTHALNASFQDRFVICGVSHMDPKAFTELIAKHNPEKGVAEDLTKVYVTLINRVLGLGSTLPEEALSVRNLVRVADFHREFGGELRDWGRHILLSSIDDERAKKSVQDILELLHG